MRLLSFAISASSAVASGWVFPGRFHDDYRACYSDINITGQRAMERKGLTMDDDTLRFCPSRIPTLWPNTQDPVGSLRLFRSWAESWPEERRSEAWRSLLSYVNANRVKVLVATPISCDPRKDEQDWQWTRELLRKLSPDLVMGFAVGNELDLLYTHGEPSCVAEVWGHRLWDDFMGKIAEIDQMGFGHVPVTSVFTASVFYVMHGHTPFINQRGQALVNDFLSNATRKYGQRFVFTFNIYPYFDPSLKVAPPKWTCETALEIATCFDHSRCLVSKALVKARERIHQLTRRSDDRLWVGEIGWSSPKADGLGTQMASCPDFSSLGALQRFYTNFLRWDFSVHAKHGGHVRSPDHIFYFTLRDTLNFGVQEHFGIIPTCRALECKIKTAIYSAPGDVLRGHSLPWMRASCITLGCLLLAYALFPFVCGRKVESEASEEDSEGATCSDE